MDSLPKASHSLPSMVLLVGEQLWPNIHSVVHWMRKKGGLRRLFLYYTDDRARSFLPACRLYRLFKGTLPRQSPSGSLPEAQMGIGFHPGLFPDLEIVIPANALGTTPQEVAAEIGSWMNQWPGMRWIINSTCGLKTMMLGAASFAGCENVQVIYRDINSSQWLEISRSGGSIITVDLPDIKANDTDEIPIQLLIGTQFEPADWQFSVGPQRIEHLEKLRPHLLHIADLGLSHQWDWVQISTELAKKCAGDLPLPDGPSSGRCFEAFLGACLLEMGVSKRSLAHSCTLQRTDNRLIAHEIDLIVNHAGQLFFLDLKLLGQEEGLYNQMRDTGGYRFRLGGPNAKGILIRPNRELTPEDRELAKAYRVDVIDKGGCTRLFSELQRLLHLNPLPPTIVEIEQRVEERRRIHPGCSLYGKKPREGILTSSGRALTNAAVDIDSFVHREMGHREQNWLLWFSRHHIHFVLNRALRPDEAKRLEAVFDKLASLEPSIKANSPALKATRFKTSRTSHDVVVNRSSAVLSLLRQAVGSSDRLPFDLEAFCVFIERSSPSATIPRKEIRNTIAPTGLETKQQSSPARSGKNNNSVQALDLSDLERSFDDSMNNTG